MRSISLRTSLILVGVFAAGVASGLVLTPTKRAVLSRVFQSAYSDYVYRCDSAMRGHLHAKMVIDQEPSPESVENLKAAEISLLACQDYDLFQKRLMRYGLNENDLSSMRLTAVEERGEDLLDVVAEHEFRY